MKVFQTVLLTLMLLVVSLGGGKLLAQPRGFNYQALARNADGSLLANQVVNVRFLIRQNSAAGGVVYEETHAPTTNAYGLFSLKIGAGTVVSGVFDNLDWSATRYFLEVQLSGLSAGANELVEVPYAKVATDMALSNLNDVSPNPPANNQTLKWNGVEWAPADDDTGSGSQWTTAGSNIHFNIGNVGIGDATPVATLTVGDGDKLQVQGATGSVILTDPNASIRFPATTGPNAPMMFQFASGTQNANRMVLAHSPNFPNWGLQYRDTIDVYNFLSSGNQVLSVNLGSQRVGIGQEIPRGRFHVNANSTSSFPHLLLEETDANDFARILFQNGSGTSNWQIAGLNSTVAGDARLNLFHSVAGNILTVADNRRVGVNTDNPTHELEVVHLNFGATNTNNGMRIRNQNANNTNWTLYCFNFNGNFALFEGITQRGQFAAGTGAYTTVSDQCLKSGFSKPGSLLPAVMQLNAFRYSYTSDPQRKTVMGFKAQEVESLFPEVVYRTGEDGQGYALDYAGFGVIAIKAIQEQ